MKTASILVAMLLSFLLLANFNVAEFQPAQGAETATNGEEGQAEKLMKFLPHHIPFYKKPFFKAAPKRPIPHHPILKKPFPKPRYPPAFPSHP